MTIGSLEFLAFLLIASAIFPFIPGVRARQILLAGCNAVFLASFIPNGWSWAVLAVFLGSGYLLGTAQRRRPRARLMACYLAALIFAFVVLKKYGFLAYLLPERLLSHPVAIVGLSYMLFRQIHFVVDCMQEQIERVSLWNYVNYQINLFALLAGPIQRYQEFSECWSRLDPLPRDRHELLKAWMRVFVGVVKMAGFGAALWFAYEKCHERLLASGGLIQPPLAPTLITFAAIFYFYPLYVYANFSGYCDVAIGSASLLGLQLPENFDRPYRSRNMIDFWTRWHRSLGFWIRDYLFIPLYRVVAERNAAAAPKFAFACYFVAFVITGIWHGTTSNYLVFGIIHGAGASAAKIWETLLIKWRGRPYFKQYLQSRLVLVVAVIATWHYFSVSMFFFADELHTCGIILRVLFRAVGFAAGR